MNSRQPHHITSRISDRSFLDEIMKMPGGDKILDCIQCGVCAGSCHARFAMDYSPMQILKMVHLGLRREVLSSSTIWICASCYTCASRCPRSLDIPAIMSGLKNVAMRTNVPAPVALKPIFHRQFTEIIGRYGRMHEPELKMRLMKKTNPFEILQNASFGVRMFRKGKVRLRPSRIGSSTHFSEIFRNASNEERRR